MELIEDTDTTPDLGSRAEHSATEIILGHHLRTGEGEENAARRHALKRCSIEFLIASQSIVKHLTMLGESGWIEDDEVVGERFSLEEVEGIGSISAMTGIAREVQFHVGIGDTDSLLRYINGMYQFSSTTHSIERESTRIAEHIEHTASTSEMLDERTVLTLIDEETGLLSLEPIDMELQSILKSHVADSLFECTTLSRICDRFAIDNQIAIHRTAFGLSLLTCLSLITQGGLRLVIDVVNLSTRYTNQILGQFLTYVVNTCCVGLHHSRMGIDIDD